MKKFNFNINNFYSIFNQMPEQSKNINLDSFIDEKFRKTLSADTSDEFTTELLKRVELQKVFAKEDVKTDKIMKYLIGIVVAFMTLTTLFFGMVLKTGSKGNEVSYLSSAIEKFSDFIEEVSVMTMQNLGFAVNIKTGIILLLVIGCIILFSIAERNLSKKMVKVKHHI